VPRKGGRACRALLLDTHTWFWFVSCPEQLPAATAACLEEERRSDALGISVISCWELGLLAALGKVRFSVDVLDWISRSLCAPGFRELEITPKIAVESTRLPGTFHRDPADRILVATARETGVQIVTKDDRILAYPYVAGFWSEPP
jgi:PIN domain nuclease of toxin-antitoxin system